MKREVAAFSLAVLMMTGLTACSLRDNNGTNSGNGSMSPNSGTVSPNTGNGSSNTGSSTPNYGASTPNSGVVSPNYGSSTTPNGSVTPGMDDEYYADGSGAVSGYDENNGLDDALQDAADSVTNGVKRAGNAMGSAISGTYRE